MTQEQRDRRDLQEEIRYSTWRNPNQVQEDPNAETFDATAARYAELAKIKEEQIQIDMRAHENELARIAEMQEAYEQLGGSVVAIGDAWGQALGKAAAGQLSAGKAAKAMFAAVLQALAKAAAAKAAFETAEAAAAYARYDYPSGAQHTAAAALYAVAGGAISAGAAALAGGGGGGGGGRAYSSPSRSFASSSSEGSSRPIVINWSAPVVTATTLAEVGIQIQRSISAAESRYGN